MADVTDPGSWFPWWVL